MNRRTISPKIRIEPTAEPILVEVCSDRSRARSDAEVHVVDGDPDDVDAVVFITLRERVVRYELDTRLVGLSDLTIMFVEETRLLFLGGRRLSCVVDLASGVVCHPFEHCLFWGFDRAARPGFVLETGELDCLFRALDGTVLARVPVDPPWESVPKPGGISFESIVQGKHFLGFPDA